MYVNVIVDHLILVRNLSVSGKLLYTHGEVDTVTCENIDFVALALIHVHEWVCCKFIQKQNRKCIEKL